MLKFLEKLFSVWNAAALAFTGAVFFALSACSDNDSGETFLFDREILEMNVLRSCEDASSTEACYRLRFRYPIEINKLSRFLVWIDTTVIDDSTHSVSKHAKANPTLTVDYNPNKAGSFDTLDLTPYVQEFLGYDSLQVAIWPEYADHDDPGAVQRVFLHFGDDLPPAIVTLQDSVFSNGAAFDWSRPTDQTDFYSPEILNGPIAGYNIVVYALNENEDISGAKITVIHGGVADSVGGKNYFRNYRYKAKNDSVWLDTTSNDKRFLRIAIPDGEGFSDVDSLNRFRLVIRGLKPSIDTVKSMYTIGITSYDSSGNYSGSVVSAESNQMFITTDLIAPLMAKKLFVLEDSLNPGFARLDSNNRVRVFFSRSIDPYEANHGIRADSVLVIPDTCYEKFCYRDVESYQVDRFLDSKWVPLTEAGGKLSDRFLDRYNASADTFKLADYGVFAVDTIRWVSPGDTLILRIRSIDPSGYYSAALIDTVYVSPAVSDSAITCPEGFLLVATDTSAFCMERFEHRDADGNFMSNVLHSEAEAACEAVSASGFKVTLCRERDWELACLSGGTSPYGVIEEEQLAASEYLYKNCNVATNDSASAADFKARSYKCANKFGMRDLPGQYQEWVLGRSEDSLEVLKGSSYRPYEGLDRESIALCTNRFFPYYTRPRYVKDTTVYLYRSGTVVDTSLVLDSARHYKKVDDKLVEDLNHVYKVLTQKDFKDTLQFFAVKNPATGETIGYDYAPIAEYRRGGEAWLKELAGDLEYEPDHVEVVFLVGGNIPYRKVGAFYRNPSISFRCCAYPE